MDELKQALKLLPKEFRFDSIEKGAMSISFANFVKNPAKFTGSKPSTDQMIRSSHFTKRYAQPSKRILIGLGQTRTNPTQDWTNSFS